MMSASTHTIPANTSFDEVAASLFIQKRTALPGIGLLELQEIPAKFDFPTQQMLAPQQVIHFSPVTEKEELLNNRSAISQLVKDQLLSNGVANIQGLGTFTYANGTIDFTPAAFPEAFTQPVRAVKVMHKDAVHQMLVGDRETNTAVMQELLNGQQSTKIIWWRAALVAGLLAGAALGYYLAQYGCNGLSSLSPF